MHLPKWHRVDLQLESCEQDEPFSPLLVAVEVDLAEVEVEVEVEVLLKVLTGAAHLPETHLLPFKQHWSRWHSPPTGF